MTANQIQLYTATDATEQLATSSSTLVATARAMLVVDDTSLTAATDMLARVKGKAKELEADKEKIYRPAKQVLDEITSRYKGPLAQLEEAEKALKGNIGTYQLEQRRKAEEAAAEERRKREEAAIKAAEEAERQRVAQEEAVRAQAAEQAERLAAEGKAEQAAEVQAQAEAVLADIRTEQAADVSSMIDQTAKVKVAHDATARSDAGTATTRMVWTAEVVDVSQLPAEYLLPNMPAINAAVRSGVRAIAGVRIYEKASVSVRVA